jgi:hypothetical protein
MLINQDFEWNVLCDLQISKTFLWHEGSGPLKWYVVDSHPILTACDVDPTCPNKCLNITVMATDVKHLCQRLRDIRWNHKVARIRVWSRPALECDVINAVRHGIDQDCNTLTEIPLSEWCQYAECAEFAHPDYCNRDFEVTWYSEYLHLQNVTVTVGQTVIKGQQLGSIGDITAFGPHLHFGVGDGAGSGIGQTIDLDTVFGWMPKRGERAMVSGPGTPTFTADQLAYVLGHTSFPLDKDGCYWVQVYGSPFHAGLEYYAQDISCALDDPTQWWLSPDAKKTLFHGVYCACGGPEVINVVTDVSDNGSAGFHVFVKHIRQLGKKPTQNFGMSGLDFGRSLCDGDKRCTPLHKHRVLGLTDTGYSSEPIEITKPKQTKVLAQDNQITLPGIIKLKHNLFNCNVLKQFLARYKQNLPESIDLIYQKESSVWKNNMHLTGGDEKWSIMFEWSCAKESPRGRYGWKYHAHIQQTVGVKKLNSRVQIILSTSGTSEQDNLLSANFNLNTKTGSVAARQSVSVDSKTIHDDIGLFEGEWSKDPYLKVALIAKKGE